MIVEVCLKDPDAFCDARDEALKSELAAIAGISDEERELISESRMDQISDKMGKWVEFGEYVKIRFDLSEMTATVVPVKE